MGDGLGNDDLELLRRSALFIGGGTCSGKTTAAAAFGEEFGMRVFSADDMLCEYELALGRLPDYLRDPQVQLQDMLAFYLEAFPLAMAAVADACRDADGTSVVAEGIAFLPELLLDAGIPAERCLFLLAERSIHDERYSRRSWIPLMLEGYSDPERAFELWMQRDDLFGEYIAEGCARAGLTLKRVTPETTLEEAMRAAPWYSNLCANEENR